MRKRQIRIRMETVAMRKSVFLLLVGLTIVYLPGSSANAANRGGLVGYWPFDGDTRDKSGSEYDATVVNGSTFLPGMTGQAILLDADAHAQGQYLTIATPTAVQVPWTASVWVKRHKDAVNYAASGLLDGGQGGDQWCGIRLEGYNAAHKVGFVEYTGNHNWAWNYLTPIDEWTHLLITGTDSGVTLYANGILIGIIAEAASWPVWIDWIGKTHQYNCPVDADLDDLAIWNRALTDEERMAVYEGGPLTIDPTKAGLPEPDDGKADVSRDTALNWNSGKFADTHDVYLGTVFEDVNAADRSSPLLVSRGQADPTYDPPGHLSFAQTYYWRIDEVNAPPDSTVFKGEVWSFTTEPAAYPVDGRTIRATASSSEPDQGPEKTIDGSGLTNDLHSNKLTDMWLTAGGATGPAWIQYEFERVLRLSHMWVWNHNGLLEAAVGLGSKEVTIEYSTNGTDYTALKTTPLFARASGKTTYTHNTTVDFGGVTAKYVRLTISSNWGRILKQYGLSEVRFFSRPVFAKESSPSPGATDVDVDAALSWRAGREAASHNVYLSTDQQAVIDGTAPVSTVTSSSYAPALDLDSTYYWRVDEANEAETPSIWQGDVWSFSTREYVVVDDFESYTDDMDAGEAIYQTWTDGYNNPTTNGSQVGYILSPFEEHKIVRPGSRKSMPLKYDNTVATNSEATRTVDSPQDWTQHGVKTLTLWLHGGPDNVVQQLYVKINTTKILYNGDLESLKRAYWQIWSIDLTTLDVSSVTSLSIGFDRIGAAGGQGIIFIDDITLRGAAPKVEEISLTQDFDALAVGTKMQGVSGWEGWFGDSQSSGTVTGAVAHSGTHSLELVGKRDDLAPHWPQQTTGQWTLKVMQYCPSNKQTTGMMYFGPLAKYDSTTKTAAWIGELITDFGTGKAYCNQDKAIQADLVYNAWVELRIEIDLYSQVAHFYYNGVYLATRPAVSVVGVDMWPNENIVGVYFDDFSFAPAR